MKICCAILAAGESKRYGKNKLKEKINGRTLLEAVLSVAKEFGEAFIISKEKLDIDADVILNRLYKEGISRSAFIAMEEAEKRGCNYLLIFLGDMPFIKKECVEKVINSATTCNELILYPYSKKHGKGFPTLVKKEAFYLRFRLKGDKGLKQIIYKNPQLTHTVPVEIPECFFDIDKPEDLKAL